jgi:hypothetical protein
MVERDETKGDMVETDKTEGNMVETDETTGNMVETDETRRIWLKKMKQVPAEFVRCSDVFGN